MHSKHLAGQGGKGHVAQLKKQAVGGEGSNKLAESPLEGVLSSRFHVQTLIFSFF